MSLISSVQYRYIVCICLSENVHMVAPYRTGQIFIVCVLSKTSLPLPTGVTPLLCSFRMGFVKKISQFSQTFSHKQKLTKTPILPNYLVTNGFFVYITVNLIVEEVKVCKIAQFFCSPFLS